MSKTLTKRQDTFVAEYAKTGNATRSAITAGYSPRSARVTGSRLLTNDALKQRLDQAGQQSLEALMDIVVNGKSEYARVQAASILLDRSWGKVITPVEINQKIVKICIDLSGENREPPPEMLDD